MSRINLFVGLLLFLLLPNLAQSQGGTWTWMHGSNGTAPSNGDFGTKGVAAATNEPPARYQACFWTDTAGNFWVFGGVIPSGQGNDLWKYDVATNMWTWMNGPDVISSPNAAGVFGTKGVPSANNYPSARGYGANCWTDNNDDLWLYGGNGGFDDLWKYNIASNQWTWVHGNNIGTTPVYGTLGVAAAANTPGATAEVKSAWVDASNDLWMFGGQTGANVLWKYDIASDQWTWVKGSTTLSAGSYGTLGVESATNEPPGRYSYTRWKDANDNLYLFAGRDLSANKNLNDVWRYRPSTNQWTWVAGTNIGDDSGKYPPSKCKFYDNYVPPSRYENQTTFSNNPCAKAFWTFGGFSSYSVRNDLWLFEIDSFKWSWISGSDSLGPAGNYGTLGVPAATNMPSGKAGQSMWLDKKNNLWVFGGFMGSNSGLKLSNDLWRFEPSPGCVDFSLLSGSALKVPDTLLCLGQSSIMPIGTHNNISVSPLTYVSFNADSSILTFKPPVTTTYRVAIFGGTCKFADSVSFTIHVDSIDIVKLSPPFPLNLCVADSSRMSVNPLWTISVTPSTDVNYQSVGGNQIVFYPSTTTSYVIHASDAARCAISPDSLHVTIQNDGITRHIIPMTDTILCKGDTALYQLVQPVDSWILMPKSYTSFNKDSGTFRLYPLTTTSYRFTAIQKAGCNPHDTINFTVHRSVLRARFDLSPRETIISEPVFTLTNKSIDATKLTWYSDGLFVGTDPVNITITVNDTGTHCFILAATDELNCTDTATDCGRVVDPRIFLPSAFTPNGDGKNDIFKVVSRDIKLDLLAIYNRYGERVFVSYTTDFGWDGTYDSKPCDVGTYFYILKYHILNNPTVVIKGDITLIR